ncbi:thioesterase domain-containing protein [Kitasatospora sp. NPDC006697]|uniref:thioesterase domain-containing protein n=1 Tax=Kitasatospora sp. NPDC006697 TaxID=3364020 RepID=UPI0036B713FF
MTNSSGTCLAIERALCDSWTDLFGTAVGPYDDFFDLGGDSLRVVDAVLAARGRGIGLRSSMVFRAPTPARLAEALTVGAAGQDGPDGAEPPAALTAGGERTEDGTDPLPPPAAGAGAPGPEPLFLVHSDHLFGAEHEAVRAWSAGRPVHGLRTPGTTAGTAPWQGGVEELADRFAAEVTRIQPAGPYSLAGVGSGAVLAFELARLLNACGRETAFLALVRPAVPGGQAGPADPEEALRRRLAAVTRRFGLRGDESAAEVLRRMREGGWYDGSTEAAELPRLQRAAAALAAAVARYRPGPYAGPAVLVQDARDAEGTEQVWGPVLGDCPVHWTEYGLEALRPVVADAEATRFLAEEFARSATGQAPRPRYPSPSGEQ